MKFTQLIITIDKDGNREVSALGHRTGHLCVEETLGCVASWLYGDNNRLPQFMSTDLHHARENRRNGVPPDGRDIIALREAGESSVRCGPCRGIGSLCEYRDGEPVYQTTRTCIDCRGKGWV